MKTLIVSDKATVLIQLVHIDVKELLIKCRALLLHYLWINIWGIWEHESKWRLNPDVWSSYREIFIVLYWTCLPNEMTNYWHPCGSCILSNKFLVILSHFFKNWSSHSSCFQPLFDFLHFLCTSENKMKRGSCRHETKAASSDTRCHLLGCDSEWSKGIFEKAKGLLMNRLFIDPWTNSR